MSQRFAGDIRLLEACGQRGCPVCRCVAHDGRRHLDGLLYEMVTDVETRRRLRRSWGFCNWHTWMLLELQGARSGAAIIYEDLLGRLIDRVRGAAAAVPQSARRRWLPGSRRRASSARAPRPQPCPICDDAAASERRYLEIMLAGPRAPALPLAYGPPARPSGPHPRPR